MAKWFRIVLLAVVGLAMVTPAFANEDRVSFGNDITVTEGSDSGNLVCLFCSIKVNGTVAGDVVTILGSVQVADARTIAGDVVAIGGDVSLNDSASIHHDVAVIAGRLDVGESAKIGGGQTVIGGRAWMLLPLAPLIIFIGLVWLIVHLVRRSRYRFPIYPQGRGY